MREKISLPSWLETSSYSRSRAGDSIYKTLCPRYVKQVSKIFEVTKFTVFGLHVTDDLLSQTATNVLAGYPNAIFYLSYNYACIHIEN